MVAPTQIINASYFGEGTIKKGLVLREADNPDLLYNIDVSRDTPQMKMTRLRASSPTASELLLRDPSTASFKILSVNVELCVNGNNIRLHPMSLNKVLKGLYEFESVAGRTRMVWRSDGIMNGVRKSIRHFLYSVT